MSPSTPAHGSSARRPSSAGAAAAGPSQAQGGIDAAADQVIDFARRDASDILVTIGART